MSDNESNGSLKANGSGKKSPSQSGRNSANGSSDNKDLLRADSPMDVPPSLSPVKSEESNSSFEQVSGSEAVQGSTLADVMQALRKKQYTTEDEERLAEGKCNHYFDKDYRCEVVINSLLCPNYPSGLIVPVAVKENGRDKEGSAMNFNKDTYGEQVDLSAHARIRSRFPVPVILFDKKFICRSGTLTNRASAAYNQTVEPFPPATTIEPVSAVSSAVDTVSHLGKRFMRGLSNFLNVEELFKKDKDVLEHLKVEHVCDLMVEYAKTYKDLLTVSSSEVQHKDIYRTFKNEDLPFPGCEFFQSYSEANRNPEGLKFDWSQNEVTRTLVLSDPLTNFIPDLDVTKLTEWDLVETTKTYLKIMLAFLVKDKGSMLVHCISGWDRTPLFISLLRLSLWADNVIHKSLEYQEMAYLTVTYDWFLFGHNFPDRWEKKEEIMHFCFNFLSHIATDEFSITKMFKRLPAEAKENREFPDYEPGRRVILNNVRQYVLDAYQEHIIDWKDESAEES